jgi:hypothetical protein
MTNFPKDVWRGFWSAAAIFFHVMALGFDTLSDFCAALAGKGKLK